MYREHKAPSFVADCHLGKLAKYLRLMGFDTLYYTQIDDNELIDIANNQERIILTRDKELFERNKAPCFFFVEKDLTEQLTRLADHYHLRKFSLPFSRCIICNTPLKSIEKAAILERIPPKVAKFFDTFEYCSTCDRIYWHGDHYKKMKAFLEGILG